MLPSSDKNHRYAGTLDNLFSNSYCLQLKVTASSFLLLVFLRGFQGLQQQVLVQLHLLHFCLRLAKWMSRVEIRVIQLVGFNRHCCHMLLFQLKYTFSYIHQQFSKAQNLSSEKKTEWTIGFQSQTITCTVSSLLLQWRRNTASLWFSLFD